MVDLTRYKANILAASEKSYNAPSCEHGSLFLDHLFLQGFTNIGELRYNELVRISDPTDKGQKRSGWYIYYQNETVSVGVYGSWKSDIKEKTWCSKERHNMSFNEQKDVDRQVKEAQERQKLQRERVQQEAADEAFNLLQTLPDATADNPYIKRKQVKVFSGVKANGDNLIVPVTLNGAVTSIQTIQPDGTKRFKTGGRTKGCYFALEGDDSVTYIAEGYATAASIAEATGSKVYIAFSAHNLFETWMAIKENYGKIVICGDNDDTCIKRCQQIQCEAIFPPLEYNDFNDWMVADGDGFNSYFKKPLQAKQEIKNKAETTPHNFNPTGVISDIVDYYNATAKREQPLFAIQCAITTCSIILARNFETDLENRTSLFLMNVAKSATGKEHARRICEKILIATDNGRLISGDGYTSSSAVISACLDKPRHITIIDEFSKYLQACQNKNSGGHMAEANSSLMQVITRLDGELRPKNRASFTLTAAQKKEAQNQYVKSPAITLMAMTTPEDFFKTIDESVIKDGFINRFIVCVSDAKRTIPKRKRPMPVPQSIVDWEAQIKARRGAAEENPMIDPETIVIPFLPECEEVHDAYEQYCLEIADKAEQYGMSAISGRSAEMALRLSLIIALSEDPNITHVHARHLEQAIAWVKFNMDRLVKELKINISASEHEASKKEILKALRDNPEGVTKTQMFKRPPFSKYERKSLDAILSELEEAELATRDIDKREGAGNRKTIWRAI